MGVALLATLLARREAFHRSVLVEKLVSNAPATLDRVAAYTQAMLAKGFGDERNDDNGGHDA